MIHPEHIKHMKEEFAFRINQAKQPEYFVIREMLLSELRGYVGALCHAPIPADFYSHMCDELRELQNFLKAKENEISNRPC